MVVVVVAGVTRSSVGIRDAVGDIVGSLVSPATLGTLLAPLGFPLHVAAVGRNEGRTLSVGPPLGRALGVLVGGKHAMFVKHMVPFGQSFPVLPYAV